MALAIPYSASSGVPLMVFPIGAYRMEFAADHLDRLLGKSILDGSIHE